MQVSDLCNFMRKILEKHNWRKDLVWRCCGSMKRDVR